jgi:hypothetical protein
MVDKTDEKLTLTKDELEAMLADRERRGKMSDEEKAIRQIVREESESTVRGVLAEFFDMSEPAGENDGGGAAETFWSKLGKAITSP